LQEESLSFRKMRLRTKEAYQKSLLKFKRGGRRCDEINKKNIQTKAEKSPRVEGLMISRRGKRDSKD